MKRLTLAALAHAAAACLLLCHAQAVCAAPLPNGARLVSITAREQPIAAFLQDLFAAMDVPVQLSPQLGTAGVNGSFAGPAERVLRDVARVYNLVTYFDGAVVHVVPAADLVRRALQVSGAQADNVLREVQDLGLPDARNTLRRSGASLQVVGTKRFVEQVEDIARVADTGPSGPAHASAPAGTADFRVFYLRYASAADTSLSFGGRQVSMPGVAAILRNLVGARAQAPLGTEVALRPTVPGLRGQGLASQGAALHTSAPAKSGDSAADLLMTALARTVPPGGPAAGTTAPDPHQVRIEADPRLNAVIVRDLVERLPRYEALIASLDVEPQTIEIEATIIDVNTDRMRELGINWRWAQAGQELMVGNGSASDLALRNGQAVTPQGRGGTVSAVLGSVGQFVARISALQAEGAARIVSSPQVVTLSNMEAVFDNTSTFYVRVAGREQVDLFNVNAGTKLAVKPNVFRDRDATRIKLSVLVEDGSLSDRQVDQIPVVDRSTVNTQALITEGESLLIGGMVRDATRSGEDKVPGLGDLPVLGNLFKTKTSSTSRVERMFLITPRLAGTRPAATGAGLRTQLLPVTPASLAAAPAPAPAQAPAPQAPAAPLLPAALPARASVVLDLDAAPAAPVARPPSSGGASGKPTGATWAAARRQAPGSAP